MKKQLKAALAAALALLLALTAIPFSALPRFDVKAEVTPAWTVPNGYNAHDYNKCVEFLEQTDWNGVKNGVKLSAAYDPNDPATWGTNWGEDNFQWTSVNGEMMLRKILLGVHEDQSAPYGYLDVSGCAALAELDFGYIYITKLDVSGCTALEYLDCSYNNLTELDVSNNTALRELNCWDSCITELDVSNNTALERLECGGNNLAELDVSNNTALRELRCANNNLTELDVSSNAALEWLACY
jgi:Leucine-rich repeat (LRR) protein